MSIRFASDKASQLLATRRIVNADRMCVLQHGQSVGKRRRLAVLAHSGAMMALGSAGIFALRQPDHPLRGALRRVAAEVVGDDRGGPGGRDR
jgi:hypothetical protein